MKKTLIALALLAAAVISVAACSESTGAPAYVVPAMEGTTVADTTELSTDNTTIAVAESESATTAASSAGKPVTTPAATMIVTVSAALTTTAKAATTARPVTAAQTTTTTQRTTTTATPAPQTQPQKPVYTEADYAEIIAAVREYAESKAFPFIWDTTLTYEYAKSGRAGFHDVVNLNQNGKDGTIKTLKYNADQTELRGINGSGGVPATEVHYNVVWLEYQSEPYFALIYG